MMRKAYLSIDFEDISHDFKREFGIPSDGALRVDALWRAYGAIDDFCRSSLGGARLTFFCTGIVGEKCPEIIARIAGDGHEIGCHYFFHDPAFRDRPEIFEINLRRAIDALEDASGQKVLGFRAPRFSLRPGDIAHFRVLAQLFAYDSSLNLATAASMATFRAALDDDRLALFPVARQSVVRGLPPVLSGGSFFKLFPASVTLRAMRQTAAAGFVPLIYLHPYEFVADRSFQVPVREMAGLSRSRKLYWSLRQSQWHAVGNRGVTAKIRRVFREFEPGGPMRTLLAA